MVNCELKPICASPGDLYDFYISNHKDISKEEMSLKYEEEGTQFFRKLIEHFVEYYFPKNSCIIIKDGISLVRMYRKNKIKWIFNEYMISLDSFSHKHKRHFKIIVIPFENENDISPFLNEIANYLDLKVNFWKENEMSPEMEY